MHVTAAVAKGDSGPFDFTELELEEPREGEILVRIAAVGVCHTDLMFKNMPQFLRYPAVLGHEGAGIVERVGSGVTKVVPGDRVTIAFSSCGTCNQCRTNRPYLCKHTFELNWTGCRVDGSRALHSHDGDVSSHFFGQSSFATFAVTRESNLVKVPQDVPLALVGPLGCGVQTGAGAIMRSLACPSGSSLSVFGCGAVGMSAIMGAAIQGCSPIIAVEPVEAKRTLALELGATHALDPRAGDVAAMIRAIVEDGTDFAFDSTGRSDMLDAAVASLAPGGVLGVVGHGAEPQPLPGSLAGLIQGAITIRGIREGDSDPDQFIPELLEFYRAGRFPLDRIITTFPFAQINEAVDAHHRGDCVKVVLVMPD